MANHRHTFEVIRRVRRACMSDASNGGDVPRFALDYKALVVIAVIVLLILAYQEWL